MLLLLQARAAEGRLSLDTALPQTIVEADLAGDGHISPAEWQALVRASPDIINYMTLPVLQQVTTKYPSFLFDPF